MFNISDLDSSSKLNTCFKNPGLPPVSIVDSLLMFSICFIFRN